tara:strand:- start:194 stop:1819 length:1626 start_codon:yes stop_codon:yes gene_type:complete
MDYSALARRWRPQTFTDFVGHEHVLSALQQALSRQQIHACYLFTGTRGVGKTSLARVFAKAVSCREAISATPCGVCDACSGISAGTYLDLIEIDAASRTKVEDTRELLSQVAYPPVSGRYKIYLIDEVHMLSTHSFNALLKTLEEPPEKTLFILATTDPQKIPTTVRSRCLQFHLAALPLEVLTQRIIHVLKAQSCSYEDEAVSLIAHAASGSARDAMSILEQVLSSCPHNGTTLGPLTAVIAMHALGQAPTQTITDIIEASYRNDTTALRRLLPTIAAAQPKYTAILGQLLGILHACSSHIILGNELRSDLPSLSSSWCHIAIQLTVQMQQEIHLYPDQAMAFDILIMRFLAFQPQEDNVYTLLEQRLNNSSNTQEKTTTSEKIVHSTSPRQTPDRATSSTTTWKNIMDNLDGMARGVLSGSKLLSDKSATTWQIALVHGCDKLLSNSLRERILKAVQSLYPHVLTFDIIVLPDSTTLSETPSSDVDRPSAVPSEHSSRTSKKKSARAHQSTPVDSRLSLCDDDPALQQIITRFDAKPLS